MFADPQLALHTVKVLLALALLLFSLEDYRLGSGYLAQQYSSWEVLGYDLKLQSPQSFALLAWFFESPRLRRLIIMRATLAVLLAGQSGIEMFILMRCAGPTIELTDASLAHTCARTLDSALRSHLLESITLTGLWLSQILFMIRWKGAVNGGSDIMMLSLLNALMLGQAYALITHLRGSPLDSLGFQISLWFISIQSLTSYFVSGAVKLRDPLWRDGRALTQLLNHAVFGPLSAQSFFQHRGFSTALTWGFVIWECSMPLLLLNPQGAVVACGLAMMFHCLVFWYFGLNRFVWAWLCSFPALIYSAYALAV